MKKFLILTFVVLSVLSVGIFGKNILNSRIAEAAGTIYYIDNLAGNDLNTGTSITSPWKSISKINSYNFVGGDQVLFKRGGVWREQLIIPSSGNSTDPITFGAYGSGNNPVISGSELKGWTQNGAVWSTNQFFDPLCLFVGSNSGVRVSNLSAVNSSNKWYWDSSQKLLYVYSNSNPASLVEVPTRDHAIVSQSSQRSYININDLVLKNARVYNLKNSSGSNWTLRRNSISNSCHGGMIFENVNYVKVFENDISYSNQIGPSAWHEAVTLSNVNNFSVNNNIVHDNAEDGIVIKYGSKNGTVLRNNVYKNAAASIYIDGAENTEVAYNLVRDSSAADKPGIGLSIEYAANPGFYNLRDVNVHNNVVYGNGVGIWVWIEDGAEQYAKISNVKIDNNTVFGNNQTNWGGIFIFGTGNISNFGTGNTIRNNILFNNTAKVGAKEIRDVTSVLRGFTISNNLFGKGAPSDSYGVNSVIGDPMFVDQAKYNFALRSGSPAINTGMNTGIAYDYANNSIPSGGVYDVGAYEFITTAPVVTPTINPIPAPITPVPVITPAPVPAPTPVVPNPPMLLPPTPPVDNTSTTLGVGAGIEATAYLNVRSRVGTSGPIIETVTAGTRGVIMEGPQTANGYNWWKVNFFNNTRPIGWVAQNYIKLTSGASVLPPTPTPVTPPKPTSTPFITPTPISTPTPAPITPAPTSTSISTPAPVELASSSTNIYFEAESGVLSGRMRALYVGRTVSNSTIIRTDTENSGEASYTFDIKAQGVYYIWGRVLGGDKNRDSFYVSLDNEPNIPWTINSNGWAWVKVTSEDNSILSFNITPGKHTLKIKGREVNTWLDRILITDDVNYVPSGIVAVDDIDYNLAKTPDSMISRILNWFFSLMGI